MGFVSGSCFFFFNYPSCLRLGPPLSQKTNQNQSLDTSSWRCVIYGDSRISNVESAIFTDHWMFCVRLRASAHGIGSNDKLFVMDTQQLYESPVRGMCIKRIITRMRIGFVWLHTNYSLVWPATYRITDNVNWV